MKSTMEEAAERELPESAVWNERKASDDEIWSPARKTKMLIAKTAAEFGVTYKDIMGWDRRVPVVSARQLAMVRVAQANPWLSLPRLGKIFKRDHSTVQHALKKHGFRVSQNGSYELRQGLRSPADSGGEQHLETGVHHENP